MDNKHLEWINAGNDLESDKDALESFSKWVDRPYTKATVELTVREGWESMDKQSEKIQEKLERRPASMRQRTRRSSSRNGAASCDSETAGISGMPDESDGMLPRPNAPPFGAASSIRTRPGTLPPTPPPPEGLR